MSSRRKKAPPLRVDGEATKRLNWNMLEDRKCEEEGNNDNPPTCSSPPPITPALPPPPETSCPPPTLSITLSILSLETLPPVWTALIGEFILSPVPDCGRKTLLLMINREGQLSIRYTAGGEEGGGETMQEEGHVTCSSLGGVSLQDLDWMQKRSLVQLMHRQEEGGVKVGVYLLEAGLVKPEFLSGGNARMKKANQLMQKLMEYFYDFIIPEVVEGEELECDTDLERQNVEEMYEHVRLQHQSEGVGGEIYDVQHQALIPVQHQALIPVQHQALIPVQHQALIPVQHQALIPVQHQALIPVQHQALIPVLRPYQSQAVNWMLRREKYRSSQETETATSSGDDLRQDMLTLQVIRIMNKIWIQEGLDMRMVIFKCFSTGRGRGMVEMIPQADTLRKIQVEHGVTGSFKDRPLADWLQKHNPTDEQYDKAVENFIYSCAGCCVATYILGICDRHNDNIMLKSSGHMFHIDFGKFLGHAQMFGNIKRDRAPFVFTSDMAYVINGGDKPSSRFHDFVDLCCEAYNLIRRHTHLFLNLLGLMLSCGIPELSDLDDLKYVYDALRPQESEADATMYFTRLIESSLGSVATRLNFFIHSLAQMKFSSEDRPSLSFAPRVHTAHSGGGGLLRSLYVCRHLRTGKGYVFMVKVEREGQQEALLLQRSFEEFQELHSKLRLMFPSNKLPSFPSRLVIGRSRGEAAADKRRDELNGYVWHLIHAAPEVAQCDLVYTFFHPLPRDERPGHTASKPELSWAPAAGTELGEVKLSISYKKEKLFIMVMHIRGL
ncbi:hypothetical protein JOQ06_022820, partial [Pogonophryne albipinna]